MGPICLQGLHKTAEGDKIYLPAIEHSNRLYIIILSIAWSMTLVKLCAIEISCAKA